MPLLFNGHNGITETEGFYSQTYHLGEALNNVIWKKKYIYLQDMFPSDCL